jgi:hypothetical protein
VVLHRTYGSLTKDGYKGAYNIGKNGRAGVGIGFHFLVGKNEGQWVEFYDMLTKCAHAKGANTWAIGVEFDGVNEGPLTDWQIRAGAWILAGINNAIGIPIDRYTIGGPRRKINGPLPHSLVPGSNHTDLVTEADYQKMRALIPSQQCKCPAPGPAVDVAEYVRRRRALAQDYMNSGLGTLPTLSLLSPKSHAMGVALMQSAINLVSGRGLKVDGQFGPATRDAVRDLDRFTGVRNDDGVFEDSSRFVLTLAVKAIADGKA